MRPSREGHSGHISTCELQRVSLQRPILGTSATSASAASPPALDPMGIYPNPNPYMYVQSTHESSSTTSASHGLARTIDIRRSGGTEDLCAVQCRSLTGCSTSNEGLVSEDPLRIIFCFFVLHQQATRRRRRGMTSVQPTGRDELMAPNTSHKTTS